MVRKFYLFVGMQYLVVLEEIIFEPDYHKANQAAASMPAFLKRPRNRL